MTLGILWRYCFAFLVASGFSQIAWARQPVAGPYVMYDAVDMAPLASSEDTEFSHVSRRMTEVNALVPLQLGPEHTLIVPTFLYQQWTHRYRLLDGIESVNRQRQVIVPGTILAYDNPSLKYLPFVLYNYYQQPNRLASGLGMHEAVVGADLDRWMESLFPSFKDRINARVLYRFRQFPHHITHLFLVAGSVEFDGGYVLSVGLPSHFRLGWWNADQSRYLGADISAEARNAPAEEGFDSSWLEGFQVTSTVQWRERISPSLFLELRMGAFTEFVSMKDDQGERVWGYQSGLAPYAQIRVATFFSDL